MGILSSMVEPFVVTMLDASQKVLFRRTIPSQLVGADHTRNLFSSFEQCAEKSLRRLLVASALNQDIEPIVVLVQRSPEGVFLPLNREHNPRPPGRHRHNAGDDGATRWQTFAQMRRHHCRTVS